MAAKIFSEGNTSTRTYLLHVPTRPFILFVFLLSYASLLFFFPPIRFFFSPDVLVAYAGFFSPRLLFIHVRLVSLLIGLPVPVSLLVVDRFALLE